MKKNKICIGLVTVMLAGSIMTGCQNGGSESTDTKETAKDTAKTTEKTTDPSAKPEGEQTTITFQTWNPGEGEAVQTVIAAFEEKNPDIKVNYVYMPYSDHVEKMKVDMASGQGPDVYGMQTGATIKEFRDFEMDLTSYADESWGSGWQEQFSDFCMDLLGEDGKYYGMPLGLTYAGFAWADVNTLKKYDLQVPSSLKDLTNVSKVLRENKEYPLAIGAKDAWINIDTWMSIANDINSEKLYSAIEGETPFTDAELIESFNIWQSLFKDGIFQDGALGVNMYVDTTDLFQKEGSIPMILNGSWAGGVYVSGDEEENKVFNSEGADHEAFLIDWNNDGKVSPVTASVDVCLCMNKNSKNPEASWKFIDFMLHEGQDILVYNYFQYCPSRKDLNLEVKGMSEDGMKNLDYIMEQANTNLGGYREMAYSDLKQSISDNLTALALLDTTPEQAAETIEAASKAQSR